MTNAIAEFVKAILGRPLIGWATLALASGALLLLAQRGLLPSFVSGRTKELVAIGALVGFLLSIAYLGIRALVATATSAHAGLGKVARHRRLVGKIKKQSSQAKAVIGRMMVRNESHIWLMNDYPAGHELRKANLLRLSETYGAACHYEMDSETHYELQQNMKILEELKVAREDLLAIDESERRASELLRNRWMGA